MENYSDEQIRTAIRSLNNVTWDDDAILRKMAIEMYGEGEDDVLHMISLAVPLAVELEKRTRK